MSTESGMVLVRRETLEKILRHFSIDGTAQGFYRHFSESQSELLAALAAATASPPTPALDDMDGDAIFLRNLAAEVFFPDGMVAKRLLEIAERIEKQRFLK